MTDLNQYSATKLLGLLRDKQLTPLELTDHFLNRLEQVNPRVNASILVNHEVREQAKALEGKVPNEDQPLLGLPIAVKDMFCVKDLRTTACSRILENYVPPYSSTVTQRLGSAGGLVLCKTNQDEFAMGSSNESSLFGVCRNPWDLSLVPGGSSGGSAAAVAARIAPVSLGTDTGGSIRQPASFCGIVGMKPTYGRISRFGIIAFASSLDQAGPMANRVEDCALVLEQMAGQDVRDQTTSAEAVPRWTQALSSDLRGKKVGLVREQLSDGDTQCNRQVFNEAVQAIKDKGAEVIDVSIPLIKFAVPIYYLVATSEASSNLARYDGVRFGYRSSFEKEPAKGLDDFYARTRGEGFGSEVKRRIILGTFCLSSGYYDAYYQKASQVRRLLRDQYLDCFKQCDILMSPVTPSPAFAIGARIEDPLQMYLNDIYTTMANLVGAPAISVPAGFSKEGLPIGVQFIGNHFDEQSVFNFALAIQEQLKATEKRANV